MAYTNYTYTILLHIVHALKSRAKLISMTDAREIADKFKAPSPELTLALTSRLSDGSTLAPSANEAVDEEEQDDGDDDDDEDDDSDSISDSDDNSDMAVEEGGQNYDPEGMELNESTTALTTNNTTTNGDNSNIRKPARSPASYLRFPLELNNLPLHTADLTLSTLITTNTHMLNPKFVFKKSNSKKYNKDRRGFYTLMCDLKEPNIYKIFKSLHRSQRFLKISTTDEITRCCKVGGEAYGFRWKTVRGTHEECTYMHSYVVYLLYEYIMY